MQSDTYDNWEIVSKPEWTTTYDTGRYLDSQQLLRQIGTPNILAISGGRGEQVGPSCYRLPVSNGYSVYVWLMPNDLYRVECVWERSGYRVLKWWRSDVFFDEVSEVAYRASCFHDH